ncbi:MAG: hypothetical protein AAB038_03730 [Planctomycetota bacterium]
MKTLLCVIAAIAFLTLPVLAEEVKIDLHGSRLAAGYIDNGTRGNVTPGTFAVPDAKLRANAKFDEDTVAVFRLSFSNAAAPSAEYAFVKLSNAVKKLTKSDTINPDIYVGKMKVNFGEETWTNNPVEGALAHNSISSLFGNDIGVEFRQKALPIELPVTLGYSLSFMNGSDAAAAGVVDDNNTKAYALKVMATMKSMPGVYFSLSQYDSGRLPAGSTRAMTNDLIQSFLPLTVAGEYTKGYELNFRYDVLEGAQKFDPSKAPLASDAKGVFRLAYGQGAKGGLNLMSEVTTMMLDAIYNVDKQWYVAFRYSSLKNAGDDEWTRTSVGGGHKLSDNAMLKLTYSLNAEPDTLTGGPEVDNDQVALLMTVLW